MSLNSVVRLRSILHVVVPKLQFKGSWDDAANWHALKHVLRICALNCMVLVKGGDVQLVWKRLMKHVVLSRVVLFTLSVAGL